MRTVPLLPLCSLPPFDDDTRVSQQRVVPDDGVHGGWEYMQQHVDGRPRLKEPTPRLSHKYSSLPADDTEAPRPVSNLFASLHTPGRSGLSPIAQD